MGTPLYKLGDACTIKHGFAFKGEHMSESADGTLPIVVNIGNFQYSGGFRFETTKIQRYLGEFPPQFVLGPGDVLVVMTCQTQGGEILGIPGRIPIDDRTYLHNQRMGKVVVTRPADLSLDYLYYLFLSPAMNAHLVATASGAKILHTAPDRIENFKWPRPPIQHQRKIASILSAYDDLIKNNTKRIKILDEMARSLYCEWFVNFHFPGHEKTKVVNSKLGKIPEGWTASTLGENAVIVMGQAPDSAYYNETGDGLPFHQGVTNFGRHFPQDAAWCTAQAREATSGDVLFSVRAPVGRLNLARARMVIGRGLSAIRPPANRRAFTYTQLLERVKEDSMGGGTIFKAVTKDDVHKIGWLVPPQSLLDQFDTIASMVWRQIEILTDKTLNLRTTRDLLLPRLISGEIDVSSLRLEPAAS